MNNIIDIGTYTPRGSDNLFFDANIWLCLYCPLGNYRKEKNRKYDGFLKKAIQAKSSIFISSLVLSEIFNAWIKLDFNILKNSDPSKYVDFKKDFRSTEAYKKSVAIIKIAIMEYIMKIVKRVDDKFESISLDELFKEIEKSDFNDNYYIAMANLENFMIVTNDSDFAISRPISVPILTANDKILKMV